MLRIRTALPLVVLVHILPLLDLTASGAPNPAGNDGVVTAAAMQAVFDRIEEAVAGGKWQRKGWSDPLIEEWLARLVADVGAAAGEQLSLPARFADLRPQRLPDTEPDEDGRENRRGGLLPGGRLPDVDNVLVVGHSGRMRARLRGCIVLVDGNFSVASAERCIVIARGAVQIYTSEENVIVAGQYVHVNTAGQWGFARGPNGERAVIRAPDGKRQMAWVKRGGVLVSGSTIHVVRGAGILVARDRLALNEAHDCVFINPPPIANVATRVNCREVAFDTLRIGGAPSPLAGEVQVDRVTSNRTVDFRFRGGRYVVDKGKPVTDQGRPVAGLEGWTISYVSSRAAVFTKDREDFVVVSPEPR